jgi:hypothetical protein
MIYGFYLFSKTVLWDITSFRHLPILFSVAAASIILNFVNEK